jgi:hypothetical protein
VQSELKLKANSQDIARGYVKKEIFTEFMKSLGEEVDRKSTIEEMNKHSTDLQVRLILAFLSLLSLSLPSPRLSPCLSLPLCLSLSLSVLIDALLS